MSAVPVPDPDLEKNKTIQLLEGELPSPINPPSGCVFRTAARWPGRNARKRDRYWKAVSDMRFPALK
jgi:oligopeptide transport system ATP-binding protein